MDAPSPRQRLSEVARARADVPADLIVTGGRLVNVGGIAFELALAVTG